MNVKDFHDLSDDGDTFDLPDGRTLKLRIEVDQDASINDYDCYGKVAWVESRRFGYAARPDGFDGSAVKLWAPQNGDQFWWMPYRDEVGGIYDTPEARAIVEDLMAFGFKDVGLELIETVTDSYDNEHDVVADTAWIGGVDKFYPELLDDLLAELGDDVSEMVTSEGAES